MQAGGWAGGVQAQGACCPAPRECCRAPSLQAGASLAASLTLTHEGGGAGDHHLHQTAVNKPGALQLGRLLVHQRLEAGGVAHKAHRGDVCARGGGRVQWGGAGHRLVSRRAAAGSSGGRNRLSAAGCSACSRATQRQAGRPQARPQPHLPQTTARRPRPGPRPWTRRPAGGRRARSTSGRRPASGAGPRPPASCLRGGWGGSGSAWGGQPEAQPGRSNRSRRALHRRAQRLAACSCRRSPSPASITLPPRPLTTIGSRNSWDDLTTPALPMLLQAGREKGGG